MTYVQTSRWRAVLITYVLSGATIGLCLPLMKNYAASHFGRSGLAVFAVINIVLPSIVVGLAALYPRLSVAVGGTFMATMAFLLAAGMGPTMITPPYVRSLFQTIGPVGTVAFGIYHILAAGTVFAVTPWRRVGSPPDPRACRHCGYILTGLKEPRCPECAKPFEPAQHSLIER